MGGPDWKRMYLLMARVMSDALDALPDSQENAQGREMMQKALYDAEEMYISADDDENGESEDE